MRRLTGLVMAIVLVCGLVLSCVPFTSAAGSSMVTSDAAVQVIKTFEGFLKYPVWDYGQYSVGYGTRCPDDKLEEYRENGITEEEAIALLREHLLIAETAVNSRIIDRLGVKLSQNQFDALVSFTYNCGSGWAYDTSGTLYKAIANGTTGNELIRAFALWCIAGGEILTGLLNRRLCEANMFLNGVYSNTPPSNYGYVYYDANGGTTTPRSQGYSTQWDAAPYPVPYYEGHVFEGWYTQKEGGTKVTNLDAGTKGKTLYAHWSTNSGGSSGGSTGGNTGGSSGGNTGGNTGDQIASGTTITPVTVTVTDTDVNVRTGPGLSYQVIGSAQKGDKLTITEIGKADGHTWGKYSGGWLSLTYTNYSELTTEPETTPTEPETTAPTEPETTAPTEPETTAPTQPPATQPTLPPTSEGEQEIHKDPPSGTVNQPAPKPEETTEDTKRQTEKTETWTGYVIAEETALREDAGVCYEQSGTVKADTLLEFSQIRGSWGKTGEGWVSLKDVQLLSVPTEDEDLADVWVGQVYDCNQLSLRSEPTINNNITGWVNNGAVLTITEIVEEESQTWGKTADGWVSLMYVRLLSTPESFRENNAQYWTAQVTQRQDSLVYSQPSLDGETIATMPGGRVVTILENQVQDGTLWVKTSQGWILGDTVNLLTAPEEISQEEGSVITALVNTEDLLLAYSQPDSQEEATGTLGINNLVLIYETKTQDEVLWGKTSQGWIPMDSVKELS